MIQKAFIIAARVIGLVSVLLLLAWWFQERIRISAADIDGDWKDRRESNGTHTSSIERPMVRTTVRLS